MNEENKLLEKIKNGDLASFNILVDKYQKQVYNFAYRFMGNLEDANDMAQEAFIKVYKNISNFRNESSFKTWLFQIVSNTCKDELRRRKKVNLVSIDTPVTKNDGEQIERQFESQDISPQETVENRETQDFVRKVVNDLPEDFRMILILREFQELSYEEIAEILQCSIGTVKSRLNRARKKLKDKIINYREQTNEQRRQIE